MATLTRRTGTFLALLLAPGLVASAAAESPTTAPSTAVRLTISPQTTFATAPLSPDGTINYIEAINAWMSRGVTAQNNAAVPLAQAIGPRLFAQQPGVEAEVFRRLGVNTSATTGPYFVGLDDFADAQTVATTRPSTSTPHPSSPSAASIAAEQAADTAMTRPWSSREFPQLAAWLAANKKPLDLAVDASSRPAYFLPLLPSAGTDPPVVDALCPGLGSFHPLTLALCCRATLAMGNHDVGAAWRDILAVHRLARLLGSRGPALYALVGHSMARHAAMSTLTLATRTHLTAQRARAIGADLDALPPLSMVPPAIDEAERIMMLDCAIWYGRQTGGKPVQQPDGSVAFECPFDINAILRRLNGVSDAWSAAQRITDVSKHGAALAAVLDDIQRRAEAEGGALIGEAGTMFDLFEPTRNHRVSPSAVASLIAKFNAPAWRPMVGMEQASIAQFELGRTAVALAAYCAERRAYPTTLAALTPELLRCQPMDPFTGTALHYSTTPDGYVLFSVGANGKNNANAVESSKDLVLTVRVRTVDMPTRSE